MLKQRIITGVLMAVVFVAAMVFLSLPGLALLFGAVLKHG